MIKILAFGNSLTEGFGLKKRDSFPTKLESVLKEKGFECEVVNGGVSGDTTYGGVKRIDWYLKDFFDVVLVELGINDGFLEYPIEEIKSNLEKIIKKIKKQNSEILLIGTKIPKGLFDISKEYCDKFENIFNELALEFNLRLCPDLLGGIIGNREYTLLDSIHPNEKGVLLMVGKVLEKLIPMLKTLIK